MDQSPLVQSLTDEDRSYLGSRFAEVKEAVFANPYQKIWGAPGEPHLPQLRVSLPRLFEGFLPGGKPDQLKAAATRTVDSFADLRWGADGKGIRRIVHPTGVCLTGIWTITEENEYSGYFKNGSQGLIIGRASSDIGAINPKSRGLGLVGKIYPTLDEDH